MALSREQFSQNLAKGTHAVRDATLRQCWNSVPQSARYYIFLNSSFDGNPLAEGEHRFPDQSKAQKDARVPRTHDEVVARLWRDGKVPEWIDITPYETDANCAYYELRCCGRFTDRDELLYHVQEGYPPFHLFGPLVPSMDYSVKTHGKFDLHWHRDRTKRIRRQTVLKWGVSGAVAMLMLTVLLVILQQALPYELPDRRVVRNVLVAMVYPVLFMWERVFGFGGDRGLELIVPILGSALLYLLAVGFCIGVLLEKVIGLWRRTRK